MKSDLPSIPDILRTVREYLGSIQSLVPEHHRYGALCSMHLLSIVEREVVAHSAITADEMYAIEQLLDLSVSTHDAVDALAKAIRAGKLDTRWNEAFDVVLQQVISKVGITKPEFLEPKHRSA